MAPAPREVVFYRPGRSFPAFSATGGACGLGCDHCRGHYLKGMTALEGAEQLLREARELQRRGAKGLLLSGGCDPRGKVPLSPLLPAVRRIKEETGLLVNLHTGLVDEDAEAEALAQSGADCLSVDVVQDRRVIREQMHLDRGPEDYRGTLERLLRAGARRVVPHICLGMGDEQAEEQAIRLVSEMGVGALVLLSFLPAQGTPMALSPPPAPERVLRAVSLAVSVLQAPVLMGCMRPRGDWRLEAGCIQAGAAGMAMPSRRTVEWARENGYRIRHEEGCCALHL